MRPGYARIVTVVRILLGIEFVINGLNWWVKLITPYPSIVDGVAALPPGDFVAAMIRTGFLFHVVKAVELGAGILLLLNRFVPLALVTALPVTVNVFLVDVVLGHKFRSYLMGSGALLMNTFLMLAYLQHYRAVLAWRTAPEAAGGADARYPLGLLTGIVGSAMIIWVACMIVDHFMPR